jgi:hypothetical protein
VVYCWRCHSSPPPTSATTLNHTARGWRPCLWISCAGLQDARQKKAKRGRGDGRSLEPVELALTIAGGHRRARERGPHRHCAA